jgi:hypothetical protein
MRPIRQHHDPRIPLCLFQLIELPTLRGHRRKRLGSRLGRVDEKRTTEAVGQLRVVVRVVPAITTKPEPKQLAVVTKISVLRRYSPVLSILPGRPVVCKARPILDRILTIDAPPSTH